MLLHIFCILNLFFQSHSFVIKFNTEASSHKASNSEIFDAEEAAYFDAHDLSDAGIESAAMERSVMIAYEMTEKLHSRKTNTPIHENILSEESVNHYFEDYHRFNNNMHFEKELMENEDVKHGHSMIDEMAKLIESSDE
ncbi:predicted protein [Chaetoceros tenuissimus]|uniref:Uncharacterized protein n=1 Tax=Chaetoceros tenuissimus TaxID=426638 RepID=A0AAD3H660_9STRA|nr:predicted protein [Chaetoceros tenuissimus]